MCRKLLLPFFLILFLFSFIWAQTPVTPGEGTLRGAIADAASGDILELESGGLYTEQLDTAYHIKIPLTIRAEQGAAERPILKMYSVNRGAANPPHFFIMDDGGNLTLQGLELDGFVDLPDTMNYEPTYDLFHWPIRANQTIGSIKLYDCYVHNMTNKIFAGYDSDFEGIENVNVDSLIFENCLFKYVDGIKNRWMGLNYFKVENCTFWEVPDFGIYIRDIPTEAFINHCTFYNVGTAIHGNSSDDQMVFFRDNTLTNLTVKNSIFSTGSGDEPIEIRNVVITNNGVISNCCFYDVVQMIPGTIVPMDTIWVDPKFADPDNGDFTLANDSPCLEAADDGNAMGDLRWDPNFTSIGKNLWVVKDFSLSQNYPNPFNPTTTIQFVLQKPAHTILTVHSVTGQLMTTLVNRKLGNGVHEISFEASNLASGIYFYQIKSGKYSAIKKMVLIK